MSVTSTAIPSHVSHAHPLHKDGTDRVLTFASQATTGGDQSCLGGLAQHGEFGFRFADAAYTEASAYREAKRGYTGIKMPFGGNETDGGFNQF